ncbi:MAG: amidohydrolase [Gammaproteobacteria bacterium]|nr:amidohydrolase [Gammaproteobacteria bacterium]
MKYIYNIFLLVLVLFAFIISGCARQEADLIIHNAKIVTVDNDFSIAEAAAVKDGKFLQVGTESAVLESAGSGTLLVDLGGRTVLPGFNDTHSHMTTMGINLPTMIDLTEVSSIDDIKQAVAERVAVTEKGEWIFSEGGWWQFMLEDGRLPNRHDLDEVSPDNPVTLKGGHYVIANSMALERVGYDRDSENPPGGEIWKDDEGEPTGFLVRNAMYPFLDHFQTPDREVQKDGIRQAIRRVNSWGMTSLREPGGSRELLDMLRELYESGELTVRIDWCYDVDPNTPEDEIDGMFEALGDPQEKWGDGMFRTDGLAEMMLDGAEESAQIRTEYQGRPGYYGLRLVEQDQLNRFVLAAARHGWRPGPHAVGGASIDQLLDAYEYVNSQIDITDKRWIVDHGILLQPDHYDRVKKLGLIVLPQPRHLYIIGDKFIEHWGEELAHQSYRLRDWMDNGIKFSLGADKPVSSRSKPIMQIYVAVTRRTGWGGVLGPDQGLTREEAIRGITLDSAYVSFEEDVKGSIEPGKYADFVVLSDDILTVPGETIKDIEVEATVLAGKVVYGSF